MMDRTRDAMNDRSLLCRMHHISLMLLSYLERLPSMLDLFIMALSYSTLSSYR